MKPGLPRHSSPPHSHDRLDFLLVQTPDTRPDWSSFYSGVWTHCRLKTRDRDLQSYT